MSTLEHAIAKLDTGAIVKALPFHSPLHEPVPVTEIDWRGVEGGIFEIYVGGVKIGECDLTIHHSPAPHRRPCSFMHKRYPADSAFMWSIEIDEPFRGKGHGSALLMFLEDYAMIRGAVRIFATDVTNEKWCAEKGYVYTGRRKVWVKLLMSERFRKNEAHTRRLDFSPCNGLVTTQEG